MDAKRDMRVIRTRKAIRQAFEELVLEEDVDRITVKAIADKACINRKTFYLHYDTIESHYDDILVEMLDEYFNHFEETPDVPEDIAGHARRFFLLCTMCRRSAKMSPLTARGTLLPRQPGRSQHAYDDLPRVFLIIPAASDENDEKYPR